MSEGDAIPRVEGVTGQAAAKQAALRHAAAQKLQHYSIIQESAREEFQEWAT